MRWATDAYVHFTSRVCPCLGPAALSRMPVQSAHVVRLQRTREDRPSTTIRMTAIVCKPSPVLPCSRNGQVHDAACNLRVFGWESL